MKRPMKSPLSLLSGIVAVGLTLLSQSNYAHPTSFLVNPGANAIAVMPFFSARFHEAALLIAGSYRVSSPPKNRYDIGESSSGWA